MPGAARGVWLKLKCHRGSRELSFLVGGVMIRFDLQLCCIAAYNDIIRSVEIKGHRCRF